MLTSRTFLKRTRAGAVVKVVREHYLREDIPCGAAHCRLCPPRAADGPPAAAATGLQARPSGAASNLCPGPHYLLPDTNLLLHQVSGSRLPAAEGGGGWRPPPQRSHRPGWRVGPAASLWGLKAWSSLDETRVGVRCPAPLRRGVQASLLEGS